MTLSKKLFVSSILASLALTACGGEANKVYPNGGNGSQGQDPDTKPDTDAFRFTTAQLAGTVSVALFQIDRAVDLAFNKSNAESLLDTNNCQVVAPNTGANVVAVVTSAFSCRRASTGSDWAGSERIETTVGSDSMYQTIKTETDTHDLEIGLRSRDHDIRSRLNLTKAATSRPGNRQTYNFTAFVEIKSESTITNANNSGPKPQDPQDKNNTRPNPTTLVETVLSGKTIVQIAGQIEVDKSTKRMMSVHLTEGTLDAERTMERGSLFNKAVSNLVLKPKEESDFAEATCGRFAGEFDASQTLERSSNNRNSPSLERNSVLRFSKVSIQSAGSSAIRLADCKPGFATMASDLDVYVSGLFTNFGK